MGAARAHVGSENGWTRRRVVEVFERWSNDHPELAARLDSEGLEYLGYHAERYARLLGAVDELLERSPLQEQPHILDVGPNLQTALLRSSHPEALVDTLGFAHPAVPPRPGELHTSFDLNQVVDPEVGPVLERRYDIVVVAEVIEHLHVPPAAALEFLQGCLRRPGWVLIQTPNGAALHKRLALLWGRNPLEPPRPCRENPGHFHEYTLRELRGQLDAAGLQIEWISTENYFGSSRSAALYRGLGRLLPATFRHGVTLCARAAG